MQGMAKASEELSCIARSHAEAKDTLKFKTLCEYDFAEDIMGIIEIELKAQPPLPAVGSLLATPNLYVTLL